MQKIEQQKAFQKALQAYHKYTRYWTSNSAPFSFSITLLNITSVHFPPLSSVHDLYLLALYPGFGMRLLSSIIVHVKTYIQRNVYALCTM